jgi:hypothetical protein
MRILLAALFAAVLSLAADAQGLVQLAFGGEIAATGGARVEIEVGFADRAPATQGQLRKLDLSLHLGERTSACDLAALLARRLEQAGARVIFTGASAAPHGPANLFVEDALSISLRLTDGLTCNVTLCEDRPASVRLQPPLLEKQEARLKVVASTIHPHTKDHGSKSFEWTFADRDTRTDVGNKFIKAAIEKGWMSELENHETWRPGLFADGSNLEGCSFTLYSQGDWRLEIELQPRTAQR